MISANIESCFEKTRKRETDKKKASCDKKLKVTEILANQPTDLSHETRHGQLVMKEIQYCCNEPVSM